MMDDVTMTAAGGSVEEHYSAQEAPSVRPRRALSIQMPPNGGVAARFGTR